MTAGLGTAKHMAQQRCFIIKTQLDQINLGDTSLMVPRHASGSINFLKSNPPSGIPALLVIISLWHSLWWVFFCGAPTSPEPPKISISVCDFPFPWKVFNKPQRRESKVGIRAYKYSKLSKLVHAHRCVSIIALLTFIQNEVCHAQVPTAFYCGYCEWKKFFYYCFFFYGFWLFHPSTYSFEILIRVQVTVGAGWLRHLSL